MELTVSVSYALKATEAINDNIVLRNSLVRIQSDVWITKYEEDRDDDFFADEVTRVLSAAGIPDDEYEIAF